MAILLAGPLGALFSAAAWAFGGKRPGDSVTLALSTDRRGTIGYFDCQEGEVSSLRREKNLLARWRREVPHLAYVHSGAIFSPPPLGLPVSKSWAADAGKVVEAMNELGALAASPAESDLGLGRETLARTLATAKFAMVSANVLDATKGTPLFASHLQLDAPSGARWILTGITHAERPLPGKGLSVLPPELALTRLLARFEGQSPRVVLLSDLPRSEQRKLAERFPQIRVFLGGAYREREKAPLILPGAARALLLNPRGETHAIGRVTLGADGDESPPAQILPLDSRWEEEEK